MEAMPYICYVYREIMANGTERTIWNGLWSTYVELTLVLSFRYVLCLIGMHVLFRYFLYTEGRKEADVVSVYAGRWSTYVRLILFLNVFCSKGKMHTCVCNLFYIVKQAVIWMDTCDY